jgi:hypothetical protein
MSKDWLQVTMSSLAEKDDNWQRFLLSLDDDRKINFIETLTQLNTITKKKEIISHTAIADADVFLRKYMVHVQQRELDLRSIAPDWNLHVSDPTALEELWKDAQLRMAAFLEKNKFAHLRFYGGLKELSALRGRLTELEQIVKDNKTRPMMDDVWDMVRCRIIVENSFDVRTVCQLIWEDFFEDIVRCRNYYYSPKIGREINPYRAIHYVIGDRRGRIFELQVQHRFREAVGMLDHPYIFKKDGSFEFCNREHELWMSAMGNAATILEFEDLKRA